MLNYSVAELRYSRLIKQKVHSMHYIQKIFKVGKDLEYDNLESL